MDWFAWVKRVVLVGAVLSGLGSTPAFAGFNEGVKAYEQGDYVVALREFRRSAEQGSAVAQYNLGVMYHNGLGVLRDDSQSLEWVRKAAVTGYAVAQYELGFMYAIGKGVPEDDKQAVGWYRKAAAQGNARAQSNLGACYVRGMGVRADIVLAYALYNLAAVDDAIAASERNLIAEKMLPSQIAEAQAISRRLARPGEFLKALDAAAAR